MNSVFKGTLAAGLSLILLSSCLDGKDVYDPENDNPENKFDEGRVTDLTVPAQFTWSTTQKVTVSYTPQGKAGHPYVVNVYDQNADEHSLPLASGVAKAGSAFTCQLTLPASDTLISVVQEVKFRDGGIGCRQMQLPIKNHLVLFSGAAATRVAATRTTTATRIIKSDWEAAKELKEGDTATGTCKVSAGKTVRIAGVNANATIYVAGTLNLPNVNITNNSSGSIVVLSQDDIKSLGMTADQAGMVMGENIAIKNGFSINNGGSIHLTGTLSVANGSKVTTSGCIFANELEIIGNGQKTKDVSTYTIAEGGCTQVTSMYVQNAKISMGKQAYLHVENELLFKNSSSIVGSTDTMENGFSAVVQAGTIRKEKENGKKQDVLIDQSVWVVSENTPTKPNKGFQLSNDSNWGNLAGAADAGVSIPPTECSSGFNPQGNTSGEDPEPAPVDETTLGTFTYAFEDLWPNYGDYDMNDLILKVTPILQSEGGEITTIKATCSIVAIGASNRLGAAIRLRGISPTAIAGIQYSSTGNFEGNTFMTEGNGTERYQNEAVIPLFDNAHSLAGQTGISGTHLGKAMTPKEFTVTIRMNAGVAASQLVIDNWDCFLLVNAGFNSRHEVHLIDQTGTDRFDSTLVGAEALSKATPFRSKDGFCWAMRFASDFPIPLESQNLRTVFPQFEEWVTSGGSNSTDWYQNPQSDKVMP